MSIFPKLPSFLKIIFAETTKKEELHDSTQSQKNHRRSTSPKAYEKYFLTQKLPKNFLVR